MIVENIITKQIQDLQSNRFAFLTCDSSTLDCPWLYLQLT